MKIGIAQINIIWEDKKANYQRLQLILEYLKSEKMLPDVLYLPEMSFTGFSMDTKVTCDRGETLENVSKLAVEYGVAIGYGVVYEARNGKYENHYEVVGAEGKVISDYVKLHPFSYGHEDEYFEPGNSIVTYEIKDFNVGSAICYDLRFPELFQTLSKKSELITIAANWADERSYAWKTLIRARAIENQCYIAAINCQGMMNGEHFDGDSALLDAYGMEVEPLYVAELEESKIMIYDIENGIADIREGFPVKKDRREDLYGKI